MDSIFNFFDWIKDKTIAIISLVVPIWGFVWAVVQFLVSTVQAVLGSASDLVQNASGNITFDMSSLDGVAGVWGSWLLGWVPVTAILTAIGTVVGVELACAGIRGVIATYKLFPGKFT